MKNRRVDVLLARKHACVSPFTPRRGQVCIWLRYF